MNEDPPAAARLQELDDRLSEEAGQIDRVYQTAHGNDRRTLRRMQATLDRIQTTAYRLPRAAWVSRAEGDYRRYLERKQKNPLFQKGTANVD